MPQDRLAASAGRRGGAAQGTGRGHRLDAARLARRARERVVSLAGERPVHIGAALSMVDVLAALHASVLRVHPDRAEERDRLVLSKGHGAYGLYAVLAELGVITGDIAALPGHPADGIPGVEAATGALGHGLSIGCGMALGARMAGTGRRVVVVTGDGELDEGSNWEAAQFAAHHKLDNLLVVVDRNGLQQEGRTEAICALAPLADRWRAFGWQTAEADGHDTAAVSGTAHALLDGKGPGVLIARTVKGKGVSFLEDDPAWHMGRLDADQLSAALAELRGEAGTVRGAPPPQAGDARGAPATAARTAGSPA